MDKTLEDLIVRVINQGASDLHISEGRKPMVRINGDLNPVMKYEVSDQKEVKSICSYGISHDCVLSVVETFFAVAIFVPIIFARC